MNAVKPARQVVLDMMTEYADVVGRFARRGRRRQLIRFAVVCSATTENGGTRRRFE